MERVQVIIGKLFRRAGVDFLKIAKLQTGVFLSQSKDKSQTLFSFNSDFRVSIPVLKQENAIF
jgi:hypothetical protein